MDTQDFTRPIFAPVILGTSRQGRASEYAAHFVFDRVSKRSDLRTDFIEHVLDTNLKEYIHKAAGVCGVSAGPFGGARMIQSLLPVLRELGLVTIFSDVYFGNAGKLFDPATGAIADPAYTGRVDKFLNELVWMARALRYARENISAL